MKNNHQNKSGMDMLFLSWFCMLGAPVRELPPPLVQALGWTVVHALWQGALIALLLALGLAALRRKPAHLRYLLAVGAQLLTLAAAVGTFAILYQVDKPMHNGPETLLYAYSDPTHALADEGISWKHKIYLIAAFFDRNIAFITAVWLLGVGLFSLRLLGAWTYARRLARSSVRPVPQHWQQRFQALAQALRVPATASLLESALVHTPLVIGHLKPVVLLPLGLLSGLPPEQIEALLAHELAHIRRRDYLVNLLLSLLETLFFFHPAIWWIGATIRREREYCCDEAAVACSGNSLAYAKALSALPKQPSGLQLLAMAASGNPKELLHRIRRILLQQPSYQSDTMEKTIATLLIAGSVFFFSLQAKPTEAAVSAEKEPLVALDTLPKGRIRVQQKKDGKSISAELQNGRSLSLKVDGQDIPQEEVKRYEGQVHELLDKLPPI
ncbi:MAG: M56 family metallopeptidase, partial [Haliscomenobacter sp.]